MNAKDRHEAGKLRTMVVGALCLGVGVAIQWGVGAGIAAFGACCMAAVLVRDHADGPHFWLTSNTEQPHSGGRVR